MSDLGPLTYGKKEQEVFLGRDIAQPRDYSDDTAKQIDVEVRSSSTTDTSPPTRSSKTTPTSCTAWRPRCSSARPWTRPRSTSSSQARNCRPSSRPSPSPAPGSRRDPEGPQARTRPQARLRRRPALTRINFTKQTNRGGPRSPLSLPLLQEPKHALHPPRHPAPHRRARPPHRHRPALPPPPLQLAALRYPLSRARPLHARLSRQSPPRRRPLQPRPHSSSSRSRSSPRHSTSSNPPLPPSPSSGSPTSPSTVCSATG